MGCKGGVHIGARRCRKVRRRRATYGNRRLARRCGRDPAAPRVRARQGCASQLLARSNKMKLSARCIASLMLVAFVAARAFAAPATLPAYGANPQQTSVSGLSSGAFMAVQLQVAYSASIIGAGVIAGGPYYCAANNVNFTDICMGHVPSVRPNPVLMINAAKTFASGRLIDSLSNLPTRRIYNLSGTDD